MWAAVLPEVSAAGAVIAAVFSLTDSENTFTASLVSYAMRMPGFAILQTWERYVPDIHRQDAE